MLFLKKIFKGLTEPMKKEEISEKEKTVNIKEIEKEEIEIYSNDYDRKKTLMKIQRPNKIIEKMKIIKESDGYITVEGKNVNLFGKEKMGHYILAHGEKGLFFIKENKIILFINEQVYSYDGDFTSAGYMVSAVNLGFEYNNRYSILFFNNQDFLGEKIEKMTIKNLKILDKSKVIYFVFNEESHNEELVVSDLLNEQFRIKMIIKGNYEIKTQKDIIEIKDITRNFIWKLDYNTGKSLNEMKEIEDYIEKVKTPYEKFEEIKYFLEKIN